jgi:CxxC motif-containing protein (DUF1111 family)
MFIRTYCCAAALVLFIAVSANANFGDPLSGLTSTQLQDFNNGRNVFTKVDDPVADGLGPIFNEASCATCHTGPAGTPADSAVGGTTERLETRFGRNNGGIFDPLASEGGSLLQDHAIGDVSQYLPNDNNPNPPADCFNGFIYGPEVIPGDANVVAQRRTTPLFGLGLVDALTDGQLIYNQLLEEFYNQYAPAGRISYVTNPDTGRTNVGRFGWKAQVPTLHVFSGDAYLNEMGVTNPSFPVENCQNAGPDNCPALFTACNPFPQLNDDGGDVNNFTNFMKLLAPAPRGSITPSVSHGAYLFDAIGCTDCHTPTFQTGFNPIAALSNKVFHPYSDFLLHDMGSLGDGITQNQATGRLMRTAPLWGLRTQTALLHDGRANDPNQVTRILQAMEAHEQSPEAFISEFIFDNFLYPNEQTDVLNFLRSL